MRPVPATALAALLAATAAAPADAATRLVVKGAGFGHGIGMSQYGAYGFALQGRGHEDILSHYYTGTRLGRLGTTPTVRVLVGTGRSATVAGVARIGDEELDPSRAYRLSRGGQGVVVRGGDTELTAPVVRLEGDGEPVRINGRAYRGAVEARPNGSGGLNTVNAVDLESYVRGVVAAESPASWPIEALRAQAIAARTYAVTSRAGSVSDGFDQYQDTRSQVYGGVAAETPPTDLAVQTTAGRVVTLDGRPVTTFFFSTSGGRTENIENSFVGAAPQPWLKSVEDPFDRVSPKHRWTFRFTVDQATAKLRGLVKGRFRSIKVVKRGVSPRVVHADVIGTGGRTRVTGPQLRARLGLFDTWATFTTVASSARREGPKAGGTPDARAADVRGTAVRQVVGWVAPARQGQRVRLQRRTGTRWVTVGEGRLRANGSYSITAPEPGRFRVVRGTVAGPEIRVP
jgi:stage II sporulation protein D